MKKVLIIFALIILSGCATVGRERAVNAHMSDIGSTAVGLALGATEMNPLGLVALVLKKIQMDAIEAEPEATVRAEAYGQVAAITNGAVANNVCVAASLAVPALLPFALGGGCLAIGFGWGVHEYDENTNGEKLYDAICAEWKRDNPAFVCLPYEAAPPYVKPIVAQVEIDAP